MPKTPAYTNKSQIKKFQKKLKDIGLYNGPIDGVYGNQTEQAHIQLNNSQEQADLLKPLKNLIGYNFRTAAQYTGVPLNTRQYLTDLMGGSPELNKSDLTNEELEALRNVVRTNLKKGKKYIDYEDYNTGSKYSDVGGKKLSIDELQNKESNPYYTLKTTLGQAKINTNKGDTTVTDQYNFNNQGITTFMDAAHQVMDKQDSYSLLRNTGALLGSGPGQGSKIDINTSMYPIKDKGKRLQQFYKENPGPKYQDGGLTKKFVRHDPRGYSVYVYEDKDGNEVKFGWDPDKPKQQVKQKTEFPVKYNHKLLDSDIKEYPRGSLSQQYIQLMQSKGFPEDNQVQPKPLYHEEDIMMPNGQRKSRSSFINQYQQPTWDTQTKQQGGKIMKHKKKRLDPKDYNVWPEYGLGSFIKENLSPKKLTSQVKGIFEDPKNNFIQPGIDYTHDYALGNADFATNLIGYNPIKSNDYKTQAGKGVTKYTDKWANFAGTALAAYFGGPAAGAGVSKLQSQLKDPNSEDSQDPDAKNLEKFNSLIGDQASSLFGGMKKGGWIQKAINPKHKGYCTPMTKSTCTPHRKALAMTFKKHHGFHADGGRIDPFDLLQPHWYYDTPTEMGYGGFNTAPAELEKQENVQTPQGQMIQYNGPHHDQGGIQTELPVDSMVFSDQLKFGKKTFADHNKPYVNKNQKAEKFLKGGAQGQDKLWAQKSTSSNLEKSKELFTLQENLKDQKMNQSIQKVYTARYGGSVPKYDGGGKGKFPDPSGNLDWTYDYGFRNIDGENKQFWMGYKNGERFDLLDPKYQSSIDLLNKTYNSSYSTPVTPQQPVQAPSSYVDNGFRFYQPNNSTPITDPYAGGQPIDWIHPKPKEDFRFYENPGVQTPDKTLTKRDKNGNLLKILGRAGINNIGNLAYLFNEGKRYDKVKYPEYKPSLLDPSEDIRQTNLAYATGDYNIKNASGSNLGTYLSNRLSSANARQKAVSKVLGEYRNANTQIQNQTGIYNNDIKIKGLVDTAGNKGEALTNYYKALNGLGQNTAQQWSDEERMAALKKIFG